MNNNGSHGGMIAAPGIQAYSITMIEALWHTGDGNDTNRYSTQMIQSWIPPFSAVTGELLRLNAGFSFHAAKAIVIFTRTNAILSLILDPWEPEGYFGM